VEKVEQFQAKFLDSQQAPAEAEAEAETDGGPSGEVAGEVATGPNVAARMTEIGKQKAAIAAIKAEIGTNERAKAVLEQFVPLVEIHQSCIQALAIQPPLAQTVCLEAIEENAVKFMGYLRNSTCLSALGVDSGGTMDKLNNMIEAARRGEAINVADLEALNAEVSPLKKKNEELEKKMEDINKAMSDSLQRPMDYAFENPELGTFDPTEANAAIREFDEILARAKATREVQEDE
jgi:hypothetical protein